MSTRAVNPAPDVAVDAPPVGTPERWEAQPGGRRAALAGTLLVGVVALVYATVSPSLSVAVAALALIVTICLRSPGAGMVAALAAPAMEGLLKARLTAEDVKSPLALGAALIDIALIVAVVCVLLRDRGTSLRTVWRNAGRAEHVVWSLGLVWLVVSVPQILVGGSIGHGLEGFRLTQGYVPLVLAGAALFAAEPDELFLTRLLLALFGVVAAVALVFRIAGPPGWLYDYAYGRTVQASFGSLVRAFGTFSSPQDLASFVVPATVFSFALAFLDRRVRLLAGVVFVLGAVTIVESYVRIALGALGIGVLVVAVVLVLASRASRRVRVAALLAGIAIALGGYAAAVAAGGASKTTEYRAKGLSHPFQDASLKERLKLWPKEFRKALHHPAGTGVGTVGRATGTGKTQVYTDNAYLKVAVEQGIPVALIFTVALIGTCALIGRRLIRAGPFERPLGVAALGGSVSFLTLLTLGEYIELPGKTLFWLMLGIAAWFAYGAVPKGRRARAGGSAAARPHVGKPRARSVAIGVAVLAVCAAIPPLITSARDRHYRATAHLVPLPGGGLPANVTPLTGVRNFAASPLLLAGPVHLAAQAGYLPASATANELSRQIVVRPEAGGTVGMTVMAGSPHQAEGLARVVASAVSTDMLNGLRTRAQMLSAIAALRAQLREPRRAPSARRAAQRRLADFQRVERGFQVSPPVRLVSVTDAPSRGVDRVLSHLPGVNAVRRSGLWAAVGGLLVGLLLLAAASVAMGRSRPRWAG